MDEAGTPFCITIDGDTLKDGDGKVTIRDRDTAQQEHVNLSQVKSYLSTKLA
jgi:glycyl-tRNA synthetase